MEIWSQRSYGAPALILPPLSPSSVAVLPFALELRCTLSLAGMHSRCARACRIGAAGTPARIQLACSSLRRLSQATPDCTSPFDKGGSLPPFATKSTADVILGSAIFGLCSKPWLVQPALSVLRSSFDLQSAPPKAHTNMITTPLHWAMRSTVFRHFCAGETVADCRRIATAMADAQVKLIVGASVWCLCVCS